MTNDMSGYIKNLAGVINNIFAKWGADLAQYAHLTGGKGQIYSTGNHSTYGYGTGSSQVLYAQGPGGGTSNQKGVGGLEGVAAGALGVIAVDLSTPDPTDANPYKLGAYSLIWSGAYLYLYSGDLVAKMNREIEGIKQRVSNGQGYAYELRVRQTGIYKDVRGNKVSLKVGDIWKFGESTKNIRYTSSELANMVPGGVYMNKIYSGNLVEIKIFEKYLIYGYYLRNGSLPPVNRIFR